ncbi:MAG: hypothetical protein AABX33_01870 [Nanoarchaeota archaeon]
MDIAKDFTTSFNELKKHKVIAVPTLLSLIIPSILFLIFFYASGLYGLSTDLLKLYQQFDEEQRAFLFENPDTGNRNNTLNQINYIFETDEYKRDFINYLGQKGYDWKIWLSLINPGNIALLITFVLAIFIISLYLSCASFAIITLNLKNKDLSFSNTIALTNRFLLSLLSLRLLFSIIIGLPILLGILMTVVFFFINVILGGVFTFLLIIGAIAYAIFIGIRLFFSTPIMFIEEKKAKDSIKTSYNLTKHHSKQVLIVFAIIYGIMVFLNSFIGSPLYSSFINLFTTGSILKFIVTLLVVIFFLVLEAFTLAFENMFFFYSYIDFKKAVK